MSYSSKKLIIKFFFILFLLLAFVKYSISIVRNEFLNFLKSDKFDHFIMLIFDDKLHKMSEAEISEEKKVFYQKKIQKIIKKFETN